MTVEPTPEQELRQRNLKALVTLFIQDLNPVFAQKVLEEVIVRMIDDVTVPDTVVQKYIAYLWESR